MGKDAWNFASPFTNLEAPNARLCLNLSMNDLADWVLVGFEEERTWWNMARMSPLIATAYLRKRRTLIRDGLRVGPGRSCSLSDQPLHSKEQSKTRWCLSLWRRSEPQLVRCLYFLQAELNDTPPLLHIVRLELDLLEVNAQCCGRGG